MAYGIYVIWAYLMEVVLYMFDGDNFEICYDMFFFVQDVGLLCYVQYYLSYDLCVEMDLFRVYF